MVCVARLLHVLLLLTLPVAVQADLYQSPFYYTTSNGMVTITGYTGSGGAITITNSISGLPVTSVGYQTFSRCVGLTSVIIPVSVTNIGDQAFSDCASLTNVILPNNVPSIGNKVFKNCVKLTSVTIPNSVISIGPEAFSGCTSLTNVTIPNNVTSIGNAFQGCTSLTSVAIPSSVTNMLATFDACTSLTMITVNTNNSVYSSTNGILFNKNQSTLIQFPGGKTGSYTIPSSVTDMGQMAFFDCIGLTNLTIPSSVSIIESEALADTCLTMITVNSSNSFYSSTNGVLFDKNQGTLIQYPGGKTGNYTIPSSVTSIGTFAFVGCIGLTNVTIPSSVNNIFWIGALPFFQGCTNLTVITVNTNNSILSSTNGVLFNKSQSMLIQYPGGKTGSYTIPNSVTSIGTFAFANSVGLTNVTIPSSVTSIGTFAFYGCTGLTSISIPNSVTSIGSDAFAGCTSLTSVTIPANVTKINSETFLGCSGLTNVTIPLSVTNIGSSAFYGRFWVCGGIFPVKSSTCV